MRGMALPKEIAPSTVKQLLDEGKHLVLLDVREPEEVALVHISGSIHIPMREIPSRLHELDPDQDIVVYCHHGMRSANVCGFLQQHQFDNVANLTGGIDAWAATVDPSLPRY